MGQTLFGRIKIVSLTAFFLMKNMLRHDRQKKWRSRTEEIVKSDLWKKKVQRIFAFKNTKIRYSDVMLMWNWVETTIANYIYYLV